MGITVITSLLAGLYPAFYLASFSATEVLKGQIHFKNRFSFSLTRKWMIVFQFTISIGLIVTSLVILKQLHFIQQKDLGFDERNLVVIPLGTEGERSRFEPLKNAFLSHPDVHGVTSAVNYPGRGYINQKHWITGGVEKAELAQMGFVGPRFLEIFNIDLFQGRGFNKENPEANLQAVIINETAARRFELGDNPIGKKISRTDPNTEEKILYEVIGVTQDFNTESLREAIQPVVLYPVNFNVNIIVRIAPGQAESALSFMRATFEKINPAASFEYRFVSDFLSDYYRTDKNFLKIVGSFTVLAMFIAGMGLLGLVGYFVQGRVKELAIRKVLGANIAQIVGLLSIDFIKLVLLGFLFAIPIAWYAMHRWLQDFAYRIEIGPGVFALAGGMALLIALLTVSWQSIRAALANPVESLRSE